MGYGLGVAPLDTSPPAAITPPTTAGAGPEQTLLAILRQIGDLQNQPLVPDNPLAQIGTALSGFAAGTKGQPNPALEAFKADRAAQMQSLLGTASIAGTIDSMQHRRVTEALARTREERLLTQAEVEGKRKEKEFALQAWKAGKDDPVESTRKGALVMGQKAGIIDPAANVDELARFPGSVMEKAHDRAISLIEADHNPLDPQFASLIPSALRPQIEQYMTLPRAALNEMRFKPKDPTDVHRDLYVSLAQKAKAGTLAADEQPLYEALREVLKLGSDRQREISEYAGLIEEHERTTNQPPKPKFAYYQQAIALTKLEPELRDFLTSKGTFSPTPADIAQARQAIRAEKNTDAQVRSLRTRAVQEYNARLGGNRVDEMFSNYTDEDLRKLTMTQENVIGELLRNALGGAPPPPGSPTPRAMLRNGKTYDENVAELMRHGRTREQAGQEIDALKAKGKL